MIFSTSKFAADTAIHWQQIQSYPRSYRTDTLSADGLEAGAHVDCLYWPPKCSYIGNWCYSTRSYTRVWCPPALDRVHWQRVCARTLAADGLLHWQLMCSYIAYIGSWCAHTLQLMYSYTGSWCAHTLAAHVLIVSWWICLPGARFHITLMHAHTDDGKLVHWYTVIFLLAAWKSKSTKPSVALIFNFKISAHLVDSVVHGLWRQSCAFSFFAQCKDIFYVI